MALKASPEAQEQLLALQEVDTRIRQLDHRAKNVPEIAIVASLSSEADAIRQRLLAETGVVEDSRLELSRIESDVAVVEARIARDVERLQGSSSAKDIAGLEAELSSLRKRRDDLEEIQLGVMERLEGEESVVSATTAEHDALKAKVEPAETERDAALTAISSERGHAAANRATIAAKLPEDLLALYERQSERYGTGASHLRFGISSASGVRLNESDMASIRTAAPDDVVLCPDSQAILVRTSESGL